MSSVLLNQLGWAPKVPMVLGLQKAYQEMLEQKIITKL
jgi:hypothetical protein